MPVWGRSEEIMSDNRKVYIIGHKNPDTDSICSAIAYADIKNRSDEKKYQARRAGQLNEETQYVLERFKVQPPAYIGDVGTQVKDMDIRQSPDAYSYFSIKQAWSLMKDSGVVTLPIKNREGNLEGLVTVGDIAKTYMETSDNRMMSMARTQYQSMADTVDGKVEVGNSHGYFINGKVLVGAADTELMGQHIDKDDLVIMANREEDQCHAIDIGASCIILCLSTEVSDKVRKKAEEAQCVVITSPQDTYTVARLINQSIPVRHIMKKDNLITFHTEDYTDNIRDIMIKHRHRAFPVISKKGKCVGTISRRNFLGMHKKQVILVDHNERDQAVDNIEDADILEIIDHHRLGSLETIQPVLFRNEPVGCTATIMYRIYQEQNLEIPPQIAGLLCAAIISDTLMFRSPTCTISDKMAAGALALIAEIDIEKFSSEMFKAGGNLKDKSPEEIFYQDYKKFMTDNVTFGVGQISSMNTEELQDVKDRIIPFMKSECGRNGVTQVYFMLTNIMDRSTELLCYGEDSERMAIDAFGIKPNKGSCSLPGVVSRKKQLIPGLMEAAQDI